MDAEVLGRAPQARTAKVILMRDVLTVVAAAAVIFGVFRLLDWYGQTPQALRHLGIQEPNELSGRE